VGSKRGFNARLWVGIVLYRVRNAFDWIQIEDVREIKEKESQHRNWRDVMKGVLVGERGMKKER